MMVSPKQKKKVVKEQLIMQVNNTHFWVILESNAWCVSFIRFSLKIFIPTIFKINSALGYD